MDYKKMAIFPKWVGTVFFIVGILSAVALRVMIVFQHIYADGVRILWYVATVGYFFFFLYQFYVSSRRGQAIKDYKLVEKLEYNTCLSDDERDAAVYIFRSIANSREMVNYYIIFVLSGVAIFLDIVLVMSKSH